MSLQIHDPDSPLWSGPEEDGITFSLLSRFLECRERFRLLVYEGLREPLGWEPKIEYGSLFHEGLEAYQNGEDPKKAIYDYARKLKSTYPADTEDIDYWTSICYIQFQEYTAYWESRDKSLRKELLQEESFCVPYVLPNQRTVLLRGKYDSVFQLKKTIIYIQENKTKGYIDEQRIGETLHGNFQSMLYQVALRASIYNNKINNINKTVPIHSSAKVAGVCYNIIRRPLSERNPIRRRKTETLKQFHARVGEKIRENPHHYFIRITSPISVKQLTFFQKHMLDPILMSLCTWWDHVTSNKNPFDKNYQGIHFQTPWGMWNALSNGFQGQYYDYLTKGTTSSLEEVTSLFPEL